MFYNELMSAGNITCAHEGCSDFDDGCNDDSDDGSGGSCVQCRNCDQIGSRFAWWSHGQVQKACFLDQGGKHKKIHLSRLAKRIGKTLDVAEQSGMLDGDPEVDVLLELFCLGLISAGSLQEIGHAANLVAPRPQMRCLASLGTCGTHRNNVFRDLHAKLQLGNNDVADPMFVVLPMLNRRTQPPSIVSAEFPLLLPHEYLSRMYEFHRDEFNDVIVGPNPLQDFWSHVPGNSKMLNGHAVKRVHNYSNRAVPMRLHGDDVPVGKAAGRSLNVLSISSMTGKPGASWTVKVLMAGIMTSSCCKPTDGQPGTMDLVWDILLWSLTCMLEGVWPVTDWEGKPLTGWRLQKGLAKERLFGDYVLSLFLVSADMDYLSNKLGLRHFNNVARPCFRCKCGPMIPALDLRPCASWRSVQETVMDMMLEDRHKLFNYPRLGLSFFNTLIVLLHVLDLGVAQQIGGSVIYMLVFDLDLPHGLESRMAHVWNAMTTVYDQLGTPTGERLPHDRFARIFESSKSYMPTEFPELHCKGAVGRHCVQVLKHVVNNLAGDVDSFNQVRELLQNLSNFYDIIMFNGQWLDEDIAQDAYNSLSAVGVFHQSLCHYWTQLQNRT